MFGKFQGNLEIYEKVLDILASVSGFSLHFYKDKTLSYKALHSFNIIVSFTVSILSSETILKDLLDNLAPELSFLIANCLSDILMLDLDKITDLAELISLVYQLTIGLFSRKIICDNLVFTNLLKFWGRLSVLSKKTTIVAQYNVQIR